METIETEFNEEKASDRANEDAKRIAIISYITVIGLMIAFVMNNEKKHSYTHYHIRQSIGLCLTGFALAIFGVIPIIGWLINIVGIFFLFYMWVIALVNAINGKENPAPFLGRKYEEWFKTI